MQSHLYFASTPNLQSLCTVLVKVGGNHTNDNSAALKVQPQVIRCRELIFTDDNVLASPSLQEKTHIYIIVQQSYWRTGQFQSLCKKLGLEFMKPVRVISTIFQSCFSYTLKAKLAPLWNKVGELYIHGRDFLVNSGPLPAVVSPALLDSYATERWKAFKHWSQPSVLPATLHMQFNQSLPHSKDLDLNVTETEICLALKGLGVNFPIPSLSSFRVSPAVLSEFQRKATETIPEFSIQEKWSHVLPSLKKGKVISVTHSIPESSPFKKYKDIRRYWKNAYGYRLPEDDRGMYFFNIYFPMIGSNIFTYPSLCVRRIEPQIIPRIDPKSILQAFLRDVKVKMPSVCGLPLQFCDQAKYTKNVMAEATLQVHLLSGNTLTSEPPQTSKRLPMRSLNSIPQAVCPPHMLDSMTSEHEPAAERSSTTTDHSTKDIHPNPPTPSHNSSSRASCSVFRMPFSFQDVANTAQRGTSSSRVVPMFQPRDMVQNVHHTQQPANPTGPRIVPTFKPNKRRSMPALKKYPTSTFPNSSNQTQHMESIPQTQRIDNAQSTALMQRISARGEPAGNKKQFSLPTPICATSCRPLCVTLSAPMYVTSSGNENVISSASTTLTAPQRTTGIQHWSPVGIDPVRRPETELYASRNVTPFQQGLAPVAPSAVVMSVSADNPSESFPLIPCASQQQGILVPDINRSHQQKRPQEVCSSNQTVKRARTGLMHVQPNVELMAVNDQLHKVNAVTLSTWLKGKNIYVKSREKKADLIQKVLDFITAQKSEN